MDAKEVRIGLIGLGQRGMATLERYTLIPQARIVAVADLRPDALATFASAPLPFEFYHGEDGWQRLCRRVDIDLVLICTDWATHTPIALYAMQQGRHVAIEVPAATSVEECWQLVDTAKLTGRRCTMLENCCYDTFHLGILPMVRSGRFGELTHAEGAYIHDLRSDHGWMSYSVSGHGGNPYPTHGLGPVCQLLDIHRGDRIVSLVSLTGLNKLNDTLLRTERGRTILLQFDERTPRPYSRIQTLCGTRGYAQKYPLPTLQFDGEEPLLGEQAVQYIESQWDEPTRQLIREGQRLEAQNLMNYVMDRRLVDALLTNRPCDISVEDAALWSSITELSEQSALGGGQPVSVPDFTCGNWS